MQGDDVALIVCECDGVLTATCMLAIIPNLASGARPFGVIEHVVTLKHSRRRGHGRLVLEYGGVLDSEVADEGSLEVIQRYCVAAA